MKKKTPFGAGRTFLSRLVTPMTTAMVTGEESSPLMHSTKGIMCAGEKKCIPIILPGLNARKQKRGNRNKNNADRDEGKRKRKRERFASMVAR